MLTIMGKDAAIRRDAVLRVCTVPDNVGTGKHSAQVILTSGEAIVVDQNFAEVMAWLDGTQVEAEDTTVGVAHLLDATNEVYCGARRNEYTRASEYVDDVDAPPFGSEWCSACWTLDDRDTAN